VEAETNVKDFFEMVGGRKAADRENKRDCLAADVTMKRIWLSTDPMYGQGLV
jgi:hypothetical protein